MAINISSDKNIPIDEAYYETVASQEEVYLEETEEELRAILISYDTSRSRRSDENSDPCLSESLDD